MTAKYKESNSRAACDTEIHCDLCSCVVKLHNSYTVYVYEYFPIIIDRWRSQGSFVS